MLAAFSGSSERERMVLAMRPEVRAVMPILIGASVMLTLSLGLRQSLGLFMPSITQDIAVSVTGFTLAIAVQNLCWGVFQPIAGAVAGRIGFRPVMLAGGVFYVAGMLALSGAQGLVAVMLGAGVLVGAAMACASAAMAMATTARATPPAVRSMALGIVSAAGSLGALIAAPLGQVLMEAFDWRIALIGFAVLASMIVPAAWMAGRVDRIPLPSGASAGATDEMSPRAAVGAALSDLRFVVMTCAFFVCGMQLVFLTTHLPAYLELCGADPMLGATALGVIGGTNILGSLFFGWAGGRWSKQALLGGIYVSRSLVLAWYFTQWPTPENTVIFAAMMGFLWLGVSPLIAGSVAETFGLRWQAMLQGVTFSSHQVGSFLGALGGGLVFDVMGDYDAAVAFGVSLGLLAGVVQITVALGRPPRAPSPA
jgi:predicted MFS family arabinose efflux permease